jgi:hypothetical protein
MRNRIFLDVEPFRIVNVWRQVIEQASELQQVTAEVEIVDLAAGSGRQLLEANHCSASWFFNSGIIRLSDRGNSTDRRRAEIIARR